MDHHGAAGRRARKRRGTAPALPGAAGVGVARKLNRGEKRARLAGELPVFVKRYARKAQKGIEPNDRRYDREIEKKVKQIKPEDLDRLLHDETDD